MMLQGEVQARPSVERIGRALVRSWVWLLDGALIVFAGLPWLSPLLRSWGFEQAGLTIYRIYTRVCHQLPDRTFTLNGYPVCYCHRCTALYTSLLVMSLIFTVGRWRKGISRRLLLVLTVPMVIDGLWHLLNDVLPSLALRSADDSVGSPNFWLRMITGTLFGIGVVLWAYPRLEREVQAA